MQFCHVFLDVCEGGKRNRLYRGHIYILRQDSFLYAQQPSCSMVWKFLNYGAQMNANRNSQVGLNQAVPCMSCKWISKWTPKLQDPSTPIIRSCTSNASSITGHNQNSFHGISTRRTAQDPETVSDYLGQWQETPRTATCLAPIGVALVVHLHQWPGRLKSRAQPSEPGAPVPSFWKQCVAERHSGRPSLILRIGQQSAGWLYNTGVE